MDDTSGEIQRLERELLSVQAFSIFQTCAHATLYSMTRELARVYGLSHANVDKVYSQTLRKETERYLTELSVSQPALATALREVLKTQLSRRVWPDEPSGPIANWTTPS